MDDQLWARNALQLLLDGADGTNTIVDSSAQGLTGVVAGSVLFSDDQPNLGFTNLHFYSTGGEVEYNHASLAPTYYSQLEFTYQCWVYFETLNTTNVIFDAFDDVVGEGAMVSVTSDGKLTVTGLSATTNSDAGKIVLNKWTHIALVREFPLNLNSTSNWYAYVDGVMVSNGSAGGYTNLTGTRLTIGRHRDGDRPFLGFMEDFVYTPSYSRYRSGRSFSPPNRLPTSAGFSGLGINANLIADVEHGGRGSIPGEVLRDDDPDDVPLRRRVTLIEERTMLTIRQTWSDKVDGTFEFRNIDETLRYTLLTDDYEHDKRSVVANNIIPEV